VFAFLGGLLKAFNALFSFFVKKDDQATGAALQRGENSEDELARLTKANWARTKKEQELRDALDDSGVAGPPDAGDGLTARDRLLAGDKNNRRE
jgi:hypothetical protein